MGFLIKSSSKLLSNKIVFDYDEMIRIYLNAFPQSSVEFKRAYSISFITYCKAWIGVLYFLFYKKEKNKKYFFQGLRNPQILDLFNPSEVSVISGKYDWDKSKEKGYGFLWTGGIVAAILIASKKNRQLALQMQVTLSLKKFRNKGIYFFLIEDTLPVGSFFATIGNALKSPTILLQHGYITGTEILIDGKQCTYNIHYSIDQARFIQNDNAKSFELFVLK